MALEANTRGELIYDKMINTKINGILEKEKLVKDYTVEMNNCNTTLLWKEKMKTYFQKLLDEIKIEKKEISQKIQQEIYNEIISIIKESRNADKKYIIYKSSKYLDNTLISKTIENVFPIIRIDKKRI